MGKTYKRDPEFGVPEEFGGIVTPEYIRPTDEFRTTDEMNGDHWEIKKQKKKGGFISMLKRSYIAAFAAVAVVANLVYSSFGFDLLGFDLFSEEGSPIFFEEPHDHHFDPDRDYPDGAFPELDNQDPNGTVEEYGAVDEEYILLDSENGHAVVYMNPSRDPGDRQGTVPEGVSYDRDTNTLTLNNVDGGHLDVNLMGNGFKLKLVGKNTLRSITVWGFHYGGSMLITGGGQLKVSDPDGEYEYGILLNTESSGSVLMIDSRAKVDIYGEQAAVKVSGSTVAQGIWYLSSMSEGRRQISGTSDSEGNTVYDTDIVGTDGEPLTHVKFG